MARTVLIEGLLLLVIGLVSMVEGLRLIIYKNPEILYDVLGPGFYVLGISILLMVTGIVYLFINYRKVPSMGKALETNKKMRIRMMNMIVVFAIYIFLIDIIGYLVATIIFFLLEFRLVGFKSWVHNVILTLIVTIVYYIVFIHYCSLTFPRGIFFR
jgi:putative tricarboxylic transport membrane protein